MKRFYTLLILLFGALSSLMAETYVTNNEESMTLYFPIECWRDELGVAVFSSENDYAQANPYKQVKASKVNSMYMGGRQVYKAVVPFISSPTIVSFYFGDNFVHSSGTYRNELTEPGTWYYCYDVNSSIGDRKGVWYRSFDEARFGAQMIDINLKPETNVLYFIEDEYHYPEAYVTVYSSEYGESQGKSLYDEVYLEGLVNGKKCFYFTIDNADVFDMVKYDYHGTCRDRIDWSKPFFYQGEWYASLDVIPFKELFYEYSCWYIEGEGLKSLLNRTVLNLYHIGNNVYELTLNKNVAGADKVFDIKLNNGGTSNTCVNFVKTITVPEQTGKYNITFTYDANTQDLTHEWELVSADDIYVNSSDIKFLGSSYWENLDAKMELVGVNEYKYTCKAEMEKGLKYYSIYDDYSGFKAKDILFQIPETWLYEFTFTYNAVTQKYACDVKKSYDFDPIYFRGTVNEWGVDEKYKLTSTDGDYYVATYAAGKEVELGDPEGGTAKFKIGSGNDNWRPINFGYSKSQYKYLTAGTPCILASGGSDVSIVGSLKASKIEFTKSTGTLLVTAAQSESEYTTVYVVNENRLQNIYAFARPINSTDYDDVEVEKLPKTYQGYEVYSYTFKSIYDQLMINGTGGNSISYFTVNKVKPYYYGGVWYETLTFDTESEGGEGGDDNGNDNTGGDDTGDDNTGGDDDGGEVTPPTPTVFDTTTDQGVAFVVNPNSANPVFVPLTYSNYNAEYQTAQYKGTYTVTDLDFTAKIGGLTNLDVINYGTNGQALAPNYVYNPTRGASNGFTITGDYKVGDILNINAIFGSDWYVTLIIDVTKTLEPTPNDITLYYVNSNEWDTVNGYVWPTGGVGLLDWPGSPATKIDKTVDGYDVYSYTFDSTKADNIIFNAGLGGAQTKDLLVNASKPYFYNGIWYETLTFDAAGGDEGGNEGGDQGGDDTGDVEIGEPANLYIIGALTGWAADATWQFSTADGDYFVLSFPKGQEQELSGQFKVASSNWSPYNYGAPLDLGSVEAGKEYVLEYNVATNLSVANIIKVSKIEFTLSTQTLKITGATEEKVFDTTSDYGFHLYADYKDYRFTFKGNGVYEYDYTSEGPSSTIGDYQYKTVEWGRNSTGNKVTLGELYQLGLSNHPISFPDATKGQTLTIVLTVSSDWSATILVKEKSSEEGGEEGGDDTPVVPDPTPEPEGLAFFVAGNGGSDATGIWCNGIEWSSVGVETANNMTDADKDGIYEITFNQVPAGTWNFKVVGVTEGNMSWMGSDFLDTTNSSTGYTTAPYDGNIGFTLTQAANVTIKYNTATGKIILTTPSGSFGKVKIDYFAVANTDECYVENIFEANNNTLKYTVDIQVNEESGYGYAVFRILGNCNYAVYENSLLVEVTESGKYEVTIVFNGDYETPEFTVTAVKQGGTTDPDTPVGPNIPVDPDTPVKPEPEPEPVVAIRELTLQPFERILPKTSTSTVATFILENASTATVSLEGNDADFFEIGEQNIAEGECSVQIVFNPFVKGVYYATLTVTTDDNVSLSIDFAAVAGDVSFDPGDVPELNPDPVNPETPEDNPNVSVEEVSAVVIYAKEGTVYSEVDFEIYDLAGVNVTKLNGSLQGVYVVKTADGNRLISVW